MSDDTKLDKDGIVYEKGWDGKYHPKEGFFGVERDVDFFNNPKTQSDFLGNPVEETNFWEGSVKSSDGKNLYRRANKTSSSSSSSSEGEMFIVVAVLVSTLISIVFIATPIIAPILLATTESARKRNDLAESKKWKGWATLTSILAIFVVLGIAGIIGVIGFLWVYGTLSQPYSSSIVPTSIFIFATVAAVIAFILSLITGIAPTAIVFLQNKEAQLLELGKATNAATTRKLNWAIGIVAVGTVIMAIGGIIILMIFQTFLK